MTATKTQTRGHCQCCGNDQAYTRGTIAQHGYTVKHGYFEGVCYGHQYAPLELDHTQTDRVIAILRADRVLFAERIVNLQNGTVYPATIACGLLVITNGRGVHSDVAFKDAPEWEQTRAVKLEVYRAESKSKQALDYIEFLTKCITLYHGKELTTVTLAAPAERIQGGDKRINENGLVMTAKYQDKGRVYFTYIHTSSGKTQTSWIGSRAWRGLAKAE